MKQKIGLVVEGGGMKCAYSAGILDAFLDNDINFEYCIGVSGGAGNLASYLSGQRGRNLRFFAEHTRAPEYFGIRSLLRTGDLFGLEYIYRTLSNSGGADPLDFEAFMKNPAEYRAVATDAGTGRAVYFGKANMKQDDYRIVMASCALPAVCRPVKIDGVPYFDGGIADSIPVGRALEDGCDKLVVLLSKPRDYIRQPQKMKALYTLRCRAYPRIVEALDHRHTAYNLNLRKVYDLEKAGKAFIFAPETRVRTGTFSVDEKTAHELYDIGMADFRRESARLMEYIEG